MTHEVYGSDGMSLDPILRIHRQPDAYVTFHSIRDGEIASDCAVKISELNGIFPQFVGDVEKEFYFSLYSFYRPGQPPAGILGLPRALRKAKTARYLNLMYVDIDHHELGVESGTMTGRMLNMQDSGLIPPMTGIIRSGRGTWALWALVDQQDGTDRPPTAHASRQLLWRAIERELIKRFSEYNVDRKVCDISRVARVPGSINGKSNLRVEFVWLTCDGRWRTYTMEQLAGLLEIPLPTKRDRTTSAHSRTPLGGADAASQRLDDFLMLLQMRGNGLDEGCRNFGALTYAWLLRSCRYDNETIEREVRALGRNCRPLLPEKRVQAAIKSGKDIKRMKDATIAAELSVTNDESRIIPRFWRGGVPPGVSPVLASTTERRSHIIDIVHKSKARLSCQDIVTLLAFRGIRTNKVTVASDRRALFGPRRPASVHVQATLPLLREQTPLRK
jgi:hypothetical protein